MIGYLAAKLWELTFRDEDMCDLIDRDALQKIAEEFGGFYLSAKDILTL